jgi:hypothetical protein
VADNLTELLEEWQIPVWSTGFWGYRFAGVTQGLLNDLLLEGAATGLGATFLYDFSVRPFDEGFDQPTDAIAALGEDAGRPLYPSESPYNSARLRLRTKWDFWTGSPKAGLVSELLAAGIGPAVVKVPGDYLPGPLPDTSWSTYWSRFWLMFAAGTHPITGPGRIWGGQMLPFQLGPAGMTAAYHNLLRTIVRRYKPAQWVPWEYRFTLPSGSLIRIQGRPNPSDPDYIYYTP